MQGQRAGDDYPGIAAAVAGTALVAVAAVGLWRARRLDESRPRRYLRRGLVTG